MENWFISDTHFFHEEIIQYSQRPYSSVAEMNEQLILNWNDYVGPNDIVWHLGDFAMGKDFNGLRSLIPQLNGFIHLVPGNHDTNAKLDIYKESFTIEPLICVQKKLNVVMCHYPLASWPQMSYYMMHLHGHTHGGFEDVGKSLDVGVDVAPKYRPKHYDEIVMTLKEVPFVKKDHHVPKSHTAHH